MRLSTWCLCAILLFSKLSLGQTVLKPAEELSQNTQAASQPDLRDLQDSLKILAYKPMYFAYGNPLTKIQLSFRVPLFEEFPLNFGYSQIIFWELTANSKPFLDATYNPEFFYRMKSDLPWLRSFDFGFWEHHSNGKGSDDSRSYDDSYLRAKIIYDTKRWLWEFDAKAQILYDIDDTNRDIIDYVSPFEFQLKFIQRFDYWLDHLEVILNANPGGKYGTEWDKGGYQLSFDFHLGGVKVVPAFYLQYYHGFAETLLNYNERVNEFRVGLKF
ncbi:MAG TPA: phospholipase A [Bdellovibrio sp.]|uniref:phospholipase A n=1 Tax=Bdellovibrio sp. TaxID=28201 RepID=UPI002EF4E71B